MREDGQTLAEYSLIVSLFSVALMVVMVALAGQATAFYESVRGMMAGLPV
jgi:Flp pilus assembly pilin Flp